MPIDYQSLPHPDAGPPRVWGRFWLLVTGGGVAGFVFWCALVLLYVRRALDVTWLLLLVPAAVAAVAAFVLRDRPFQERASLSLLAGLAASVLAVIFFAFLGVPFHF